ncbi:MAG: flagellar assembly protein FliH [Rhodospirillaceae bacterium]|nr:flagellar assembly protein FliH [Rhodospirillales bacterium]
MAPYRKYMFDLDFGRPAQAQMAVATPEEAEEPEEQAEPEPPPPTFTLEELSFARDSAFEEGRQAGQGEALEQSERMIATALTALSDQMQTVFRQQDEANDANARAATRVALAVLKKVLPGACETHAFEEVTRVVEDVVVHILDEPRIIVKVADPLVDAVRARLEAVCESHGFEGRVVVQSDSRLPPGDCRVEWTDGGAERDQARLIQDIEATVERSLAPPERRTESLPAEGTEFAGI